MHLQMVYVRFIKNISRKKVSPLKWCVYFLCYSSEWQSDSGKRSNLYDVSIYAYVNAVFEKSNGIYVIF